MQWKIGLRAAENYFLIGIQQKRYYIFVAYMYSYKLVVTIYIYRDTHITYNYMHYIRGKTKWNFIFFKLLKHCFGVFIFIFHTNYC